MSPVNPVEPAPEPLETFVARARADVEEQLRLLLEPRRGAAAPPPRMLEALRYAVLGGGKRFRPILVIASGDACRQAPAGAGDEVTRRLLTAAAAIEMIHTFSLIHDDLPPLDDDDLRRGRATLHVRFDEATAVLAGDALLNLAYEALSRDVDAAAARLRAIGTVSRAVGLEGMISGQVLDLEGEGAPVDPERLRRTHALKTGALITACCEVGGILAGAPDRAQEGLREYGTHLGLAFQIVDDILDVEGSPEDLGKSPGKDARAMKATYPALFGVEESRRRAAVSVERACAAARDPLAGLRSVHLTALARGVLTRRG
ncbi:MAG TPA: farnesyl diphosphate synthase [Candidatus Polarisedimenticolia bacterium]|jgi:geranylgeranyl pyrophosphate synthase